MYFLSIQDNKNVVLQEDVERGEWWKDIISGGKIQLENPHVVVVLSTTCMYV